MGERGEHSLMENDVENESLDQARQLFDEVLKKEELSRQGERLGKAIAGQAEFKIALENIQLLIDNGTHFMGIEGDEEKVKEAKLAAKGARNDLAQLTRALQSFQNAEENADVFPDVKGEEQIAFARAREIVKKYQWDKE